MQAGNIDERFDAPSYSVYIVVSAIFIFCIVAFAFFLTLDLCRRTRTNLSQDIASAEWRRFRRFMKAVRENALVKVTAGVAGRAATGGTDDQLSEFVNLDYEFARRSSAAPRQPKCCPAHSNEPLAPAGLEWALHLYMLSTLLTPMAFTFRSYFDSSPQQQRSLAIAQAAWLIGVDIVVMILVAALVLRRVCADREHFASCWGIAVLLITNVQLVFFGLVGLATVAISSKCMADNCASRDDLSVALVLVNFGVILVNLGWLSVRVGCSRNCGGVENEHCCDRSRRCGINEEDFALEEVRLQRDKEAFLALMRTLAPLEPVQAQRNGRLALRIPLASVIPLPSTASSVSSASSRSRAYRLQTP
jgi:hypothetical protein